MQHMSEDEYMKTLSPQVRGMVDKSDEERIYFIKQQKFIRYKKADIVLNRMEELINEPKKERMPALLFLGDSGNGKTSIAKQFVKRHSVDIDDPNSFAEEEGNVPVIFIQAPIGASATDLYDNMLRELNIPARRETKSVKEGQIAYYFKLLNVKVLIVDEIHNILSGTVPRKKEFMNALKNLSNMLQIPIILIGIKDALNAVNTDLQIRSRFKPILLKRWSYDKEYLLLLKSIEKTLPLKKPSMIYKNDRLAKMILDKGEGLLGEIVGIISSLAIEAIKSGKERIEYEMFKDLDYAFLSNDKDLLEEI